MELNATDKQELLKRFPNIELSYETVSHKKVSVEYNLGMAILVGKKYFAWFTFRKDTEVCYLMELNKDKKISRVFETHTIFHSSLSMGTVFYGTMNNAVEDDTPNSQSSHSFFTIEDVYYHKGNNLKGMCFGEKLFYLGESFRKYLVQTFSDSFSSQHHHHHTIFALPMMWYISSPETANYDVLPEHISQKIGYVYHHIQYRTLNKISPHLNVYSQQQQQMNLAKSGTASVSAGSPKYKDEIANIRAILPKVPYMDFTKPQYKNPTIFQICADIQYDIYHLYAFGKNKTQVYYNVAYIPNYKTSVFMNSLFRNIRENINLDYIEESEDEDDFENLEEDKYVDLNKVLNMECVFHPKFKKWIPVRVAGDNEKIIHISKL